MNDQRKFPETIFARHFDRSTDEYPSLNVEPKAIKLIEADEVVYVAKYKLVSVRRLSNKLVEVPEEN